MPATEMLKATEAAVVARVSLRDVNRVIDERILPLPGHVPGANYTDGELIRRTRLGV